MNKLAALLNFMPQQGVVPGTGPLLVAQNEQLPQDPMEQLQQQMAMPETKKMLQTSQNGAPAKYTDQFEDQFKASMEDRQKAIEQLQGKLKETEGQELSWLDKANFRPALAFADSLTGGNSAAYYQAPQAAQQKKSDVQRLEEQIAKQQGALSEDQLGYLKQRASEETMLKRDEIANRRMTDALGRQTTNNEFKLRGEWDSDPITKNSKTIAEGFEKISQSAAKGNKAGDLSLIYGLMKMQDPQSVVRESEAAMAAGIGGFPAKTQAYFAKLKGDGQLTPQQRQEIVAEAKVMREAQMARQSQVDSKYRDMAQSYGFAPDRVVLSEILAEGKTPGGSGPSGTMSFEQWRASQRK